MAMFPYQPDMRPQVGSDGRKYPDPFDTHSSRIMPNTIEDMLRWCMPAGTLIQMADGSLSPVEDVTMGSVVLDANGKRSTVLTALTRTVDEPLTAVHLSGLLDMPLRLTGNHALRIVPADDMREALEIGVDPSSHIISRVASDVVAGDYATSPAMQESDTTETSYDPGLLILAGAFAAWGDKARPTGEVWFEPPPDVFFGLDVASHALGVTLPMMTSAPGGLLVRSRALYDMIRLMVDHVAGQFTPTAFSLRELDRNYLLLGAGSVLVDDKENRALLRRNNPALGLQILHLATHRAAMGLTATKKGQMSLLWTVDPDSEERFVRGGVVYRKVEQVYPVPFKGLVHTLNVAGDHSFVAAGAAVDNCEHIWHRNGTYARACKRVVSYFLTSVEVAGCSADEQKRYKEFLVNKKDVLNILSDLDEDFICYGNSFSSAYIPFRRFVRCDTCRREMPTKDLEYKLNGAKLHWTCPRCGKAKVGEPIDRRSRNEDELAIKRWSPHEIKIMCHPVSNRKIFLWEPSGEMRSKIKSGDPFYLEDTPWEMVLAILDNKLFEFDEGVVFHMCEEGLAGVQTGGWGVAQMLSHFAQLHYIAMGKLYNEVFFQEFIVPLRLLSPAIAPGGKGDPLLTANVGQVNRQLLNMVNQNRSQPGGWFTSPFPVNYQTLGAEGTTLNVYEHIGAATDELLNAMGIPVELYKGTLTLQALPVALRVFEQTWPHLWGGNNRWLQWLADRMAASFNWNPAQVSLAKVTWADDAERKQMLMSLMAANRVSLDTVVSPMGLDPEREFSKILDERKLMTRMENTFNQDMQNEQMMTDALRSSAATAAGASTGQAGQSAPGQAPGASGASPGASLEDRTAEAESIAGQLLQIPDDATRRRELAKIRRSDDTLHMLVRATMDRMRSSDRSEGGAMMAQQRQQAANTGPAGQAGAAPPAT